MGIENSQWEYFNDLLWNYARIVDADSDVGFRRLEKIYVAGDWDTLCKRDPHLIGQRSEICGGSSVFWGFFRCNNASNLVSLFFQGNSSIEKNFRSTNYCDFHVHAACILRFELIAEH